MIYISIQFIQIQVNDVCVKKTRFRYLFSYVLTLNIVGKYCLNWIFVKLLLLQQLSIR